MWYMDGWRGNLLSSWQKAGEALAEYAQVFQSVEGNTTFYGLPDKRRARQWRSMVPDNFSFSFKLPRDISHAPNLLLAYQKHQLAWRDFADALEDSLGVISVQLPAEFSPQRLPELLEFLTLLKTHERADISVEFRHPGFFDKSANEQSLLRQLSELQVARSLFDSRGLFNDTAQTEAVLDARSKKPRMPVHPIATGASPVIRFIGHSDWALNERYLLQWSDKLQQWLTEGKTPYFFLHTAGNQDVQYFLRFLEKLWGLEESIWPGESGAGQSACLFD
ncbi:DUF72 domain-containing protein [Bacterioplanoides sp.]|uniref:DUF72 domain-containing protein n=1 Tax=Bacterioplanoides sp. TaxID=2066072 RepID=UPI003AFF6E2A